MLAILMKLQFFSFTVVHCVYASVLLHSTKKKGEKKVIDKRKRSAVSLEGENALRKTEKKVRIK